MPKLPQNRPCKQYPLSLNTGRIRDQWHTMSRTALAPQLNQHISEAFIQIHPDDAQSRQLTNGQLANIESRWGKMTGRLIVTRDVKPGDIFTPMHWTSQLSKCGRINTVVNPAVDEFAKQPESKQHTRYELADRQSLNTPVQQMLNWLGFENEGAAQQKQLEVLSYEDAGSQIYRLALINKQGQLQAVVFVSPNTQLPTPTWLGQQFEKEKLDERARTAQRLRLRGRRPW